MPSRVAWRPAAHMWACAQRLARMPLASIMHTVACMHATGIAVLSCILANKASGTARRVQMRSYTRKTNMHACAQSNSFFFLICCRGPRHGPGEWRSPAAAWSARRAPPPPAAAPPAHTPPAPWPAGLNYAGGMRSR